jgi:WD40 repeat protein
MSGGTGCRAGPLGISAFDATLSPKAHKALLATERGDLWWVDLVTFETTGFTAPPREHFRLTAVSHDEGLFAAATDRGHVYVYQATSVVMNISVSPDSRFLAVAGCETVVRIYDTSTGLEVRRIDTGSKSLTQ